jgi:hypothetical protein
MNELPKFPDSIFLYDFILEWIRVKPNIKRDHISGMRASVRIAS